MGLLTGFGDDRPYQGVNAMITTGYVMGADTWRQGPGWGIGKKTGTPKVRGWVVGM